MKLTRRTVTLALSMGLASWVGAAEVIETREIPVAVSTAPALAAPVAVIPAPAVAVPVAQVPAAVVIPADSQKNQSSVSWKKLSGTVQSVDRYNRAMVIQDREGKDVQVTYNNHIRIYRHGEYIGYSDVEPNDNIVLRYDANTRDKSE